MLNPSYRASGWDPIRFVPSACRSRDPYGARLTLDIKASSVYAVMHEDNLDD